MIPAVRFPAFLALLLSTTLAHGAGILHVNCEPGAKIDVDGVFKGLTNENDEGLYVTDVPVGMHTIRAKKEGFADREERAEVRERETTIVTIGPFKKTETSSSKKDSVIPGPEPAGILRFTEILRKSPAFEIPKGPKDRMGNPTAREETPGRAKEGDFIREIWLKNPGLELVLILPGEFLMGSGKGGPGSVHKVTIGHYFYMAKYETTQALWTAVMKTNPSRSKGPNQPVEQVSRLDIDAFLEKLMSACGTSGIGNPEAGWAFRLPSEAEWEYACRAGASPDEGEETSRPGPGEEGKKKDPGEELDRICWFSPNSKNAPHPVGKKAPNAWGLFDMQGNVGESCEDVFTWIYGDPPTDGSPYLKGKPNDPRVIRGGSFSDSAANCLPAAHLGLEPSEKSATVGFRVVLGPVFRRPG